MEDWNIEEVKQDTELRDRAARMAIMAANHRESLLEARIRAICAELGYTASFEGDPRGHTVGVIIPGYRDGEGVSVPTS